jgi:hypothetical protein
MWGLNYIRNRRDERTPIGAWRHEQRFGWYDDGGYAMPGFTGMMNATGHREKVLNPRETRAYEVGRGSGSGRPIYITVVTQEINPQYHAAKLGFELARRVA